jgi:hypothetical protein
MRIVCKIYSENLKENHHLKYQSVNWITVLKWIENKDFRMCCGLSWIRRHGPVLGYSELGRY